MSPAAVFVHKRGETFFYYVVFARSVVDQSVFFAITSRIAAD